MKLSNEILEVFNISTWNDSDVPMHIVLKPDTPDKGKLYKDELETWLTLHNFIGITCETTAPNYHQNLVGIDGWVIYLNTKQFTKLDSFELKLLTSSPVGDVFIMSLEQLNKLIIEQPGNIEGKVYNI